MTFYAHLVEISSVTAELDKMGLSDEQKLHLADLLDSSLHHSILDAILSELSEPDKIFFLNHLKENDKDKIWKFLNEKIDNIEGKIKKTAEDLKNELHKDLTESKGVSG